MFDDSPTLYVQVSQKINLGNYESAEVQIAVSRLPIDADEATIDAAMETGHLVFKKLAQRLREKIAIVRCEHGFDEGGKALPPPKPEPAKVASGDGLIVPGEKNAFGYSPVRWPLQKMFSDPQTDAQLVMQEKRAIERGITDVDIPPVRRAVLRAYGIEDEESKAHASLFIDWLINADDFAIDAALMEVES